MKCHFCGYEYTEEQLVAKCGACPLSSVHAKRGVSCCPNCGIEVRMKSSLVDILEKALSKVRAGKK